jgi:hypothetical protein
MDNGNLKCEKNSKDYAQTLQRNCTFMNPASGDRMRNTVCSVTVRN